MVDYAVSFMAEIIDSYLEDAPPRLQPITQAVAHADAAALQKSAHAFKPHSPQFKGLQRVDSFDSVDSFEIPVVRSTGIVFD